MVKRLGTVALATLFAALMFVMPAEAHSYGKTWDGNPDGEGRFGLIHSSSKRIVTASADDIQRDGHCVAVVAVAASFYEEKWSCGAEVSKTWADWLSVDKCVTGHHLRADQCRSIWR